MPELSAVPDGLDELAVEMRLIVALIARTARWVQPEVFRAFPVWYPETARRLLTKRAQGSNSDGA